MDKLLRLYTYVDGGANDTPFPNSDNPIEIGAFRYDAKRMGGAPTITASVNYASCLDDEWTYNVYAMFNGEKFYLKQIPTSSYNNTSAMYKHDIELVSERVALDNVYFFDVVSEDIVDDDKPVSNSTKVVFFGDVREFANRLKASLQYSALDYDVVVDANVVSEEKLVSFEDQFFSNVLQEIYNTYEVPYYFEGKTIHIGYSKPNEELPSFAYGVDDALLSITKNNANYKVVNRATGTGSSENIPYYYPNNSPKGNIRAELNTTSDDFSINVVDLPTFADKIDLDGDIEAKMVSLSVSRFMLNDEEYTLNHMPQEHITVNSYQIFRDNVSFVAYSNSAVKGKCSFTIRISQGDSSTGVDASKYMAKIHVGDKTLDPVSVVDDKINFEIEVNFEKAGNKEILAEVALSYIPQGHSSIRRAYNVVAGSGLGWFYKDKVVELKNVGIKHQGTPNEGDKITQKLIEYINTSQSLMPSKYRDTKGVERFYNATNGTYEGVTFNNPFVAGKPKEHIFKVEDIKPSIEGMLVNGQRIDMFEAFAYDEDDNDETYQDEDGNVYFKHPYFFAKLKPLGFNLFDHAIEQQPMTISFTSGACGACNFEIAVDEESQKNTVQVDDNGNLVYDENGRVLCGAEGSGQNEVQPQDVQQDTTNHSVWIALQKEEETYGIFMPKAPINGVGGHRPSTEDTFVILGINLPDEYILNAERRLEAEIIKYLQDNNDEKFTFSIGFSRIYFAENEDVLNSLNENSKIQITYDNKTYDLYVSSFSYTMSESDALPEIKVELDETLKTSQNAIQKAINEVKTTLGSAINEVSQGVAMQRRSYVSKVQDDTAMGVVDFSKGVKFGEGGKVEILDNNSAKLTIEYLEVTKKATFTSLEIQEKTHVGGQMLVTPASMNCGEVEEFEGFYRCYFQTKGADGSEEIFNQFAVGDQAICQTFNAWGSKYYWRLVVGVGEDYIDLSKEDCDEGSGVPEAGDRIIQMGNRDNADRQNAIVIAAHGDNSPYIVQYKGINNFDLPKTDNDPRITTLLSPTKNILTGAVKMQAGSEGLENFEAWTQLKDEVDSKVSIEDISGYEYLVESLQQPTEVLGGLILTSNIQLRDSDGSIKSGINGIYMPNALGGGIAAWYGGVMEEGVANAIIRFDGSGYFAKGNLSWDNKGGASFADGKITITPQGALIFSDDIAFGSNENETVASIIQGLSTVLSYFTLDDAKTTLTSEYNLVIEGDVASGGEGQDTPASGIRGIYVNNKPYTDTDGDGFIDLGTISGGGGTADLSNYYTKSESDARYLAKSGNGMLSFDGAGRPVMLNNQGYSAYNTYGQIEEVMWLDSSNLLQLGGTTSQKVNIYGELTINYQDAIHSGNIGSYALKTDGSNAMEAGILWSDYSGFDETSMGLRTFMSHNGTSVDGIFPSTNYGTVLHVSINSSLYAFQLASSVNADGLFYRGYYASGQKWNDWKTIAFTDSNVASATKLQTARTIWGQSFDGTGNIRGSFYIEGDYSIFLNKDQEGIYLTGQGINWHDDKNGWTKSILRCNSSGNVTIGGSDYATSTNRFFVHGGAISGDTWADGGQVMLVSSNAYYLALTTNESGYSELQSGQRNVGAKPLVLQKKGGNVGIGTTDPAYKLDVNGDIATNQYLRIKAWTGYGSGSANAWYNGNTQMLLWDNVSGIGLGSNVVIHSGNIGSQWVDVANSLTNILIPSDLTTIGPKTINWFDWAQSTGQGIASYSYGIWTGAPDINYGFGFGADAFADELYFKLMRGGTVGPWRRVITTSNDGYTYGLGGYIDIQYSDEINRYGGNLYLQHRGGVGTTGSGTGGTTTGNLIMCANGGNVLIGTITDSGYKLDVNGAIKATKPIFGYMYGTNNNAAAFIFDKPGLYYTGIGSNNTSDTIRFSACNVDGTWVDGYAQNWMFYGDVKANKYRLNENEHSFIGVQLGYLSLNSAGNEICIGANGYEDIHINYRPSADGTAPKTYYWRAGSATSWADFYMGNTYIQGNLVVSGDVASA